MNLRNEKLVLEIDGSTFYGFRNIIGLSIALRMMLHFALCASCSRKEGKIVRLL
jgi:hypothetical protein